MSARAALRGQRRRPPAGRLPQPAPAKGSRPARIAIDTGGTFTDCAYLEGGELRVLKVFSTPQDPSQAILEALGRIGADGGAEVRHGTTVGTNTLLERTGAKVAFVTTAGFEDTLAIGRQNRPHLYRWDNPAPAPLAPEALRFGVRERTLPDGSIETGLETAEIRTLFKQLVAAAPEAVAVSLLFSFANPKHEKSLARALEELGVPVSVSHQILPEFREYERGATVAINAYLAPRMGQYLNRLQAEVGRAYPRARLQVMQSSGGIVSAPTAAREPVRTILSGPAGGVVGAHRLAALAGCEQILTFDMGGTSTDVALVDARGGGGLRTTHEGRAMGMPVGVAMLDIETVGAGGGSLAGFDGGGALTVGPASAGADPGPIAYGRGERATVTDANLMLGRFGDGGLLGGGVGLDGERVRRYFAKLKGGLPTVEAYADGIVRLAEAHMEKALRMISVERGFDPRDFTLVAFGGAGPLHACALAAGLEIPRVLVPRHPGALSALGILMSDVVKDYSRTVMINAGPSAATPRAPLMLGRAGAPQAPTRPALSQEVGRRLAPVFAELEAQGAAEMRAEGLRATGERTLDVRYVGQGFELTVPYGGGAHGHFAAGGFAARFHALHRQRYGYADEARPLEIVNARVRLTAASAPLPLRQDRARPHAARPSARRRVWFGGRARPTAIFERAALQAGAGFAGPAIVTEYSATTVVPPGWRGRVDAYRNLVLEARP